MALSEAPLAALFWALRCFLRSVLQRSLHVATSSQQSSHLHSAATISSSHSRGAQLMPMPGARDAARLPHSTCLSSRYATAGALRGTPVVDALTAVVTHATGQCVAQLSAKGWHHDRREMHTTRAMRVQDSLARTFSSR